AKFRGRCLVKAAAGTKAGVVHRSRNCLTLADALLESLDAPSFRVVLRRDAHDAFERPLQMKRTDAELLAQGSQTNGLTLALFNNATHRLRHFQLRVARSRLAR